jgi:tryptophan synthase alpha chain
MGGVRPRIMAHLVAGYPSRDGCLEIGRGLADGGAAYLEIQFPYSDPSADGPIIQTACDRAIKTGFSLDMGFALVEEITGSTGLPVFIMGYAGTVYARGVRNFVAEAGRAGAAGLIVPDLPPGSDEGLYRFGREMGIPAVPVAAPSVDEGRLVRILEEEPRYLYASLRTGITGSPTDAEKAAPFLERLERMTSAKILGGFGIRSRKQVEALSPRVHTLVVGSYFVEKIEKAVQASPKMLYDMMYRSIKALLNGDDEEEKTHS